MSLTLAWRLNYRLVELTDTPTGETVGVLTRSADYRYVRWLGFVSREDAKVSGRPVKLQIHRIGQAHGLSTIWEDVPPGMHVQGCLTAGGVYAVVEDRVRLV
jgi:hypothetical protein